MKTLMSFNFHKVGIFFADIFHVIPTPQCLRIRLALIRPVFSTGAIIKPNWNKVRKEKKGFSGFLFCLDFELCAKNLKTSFYTLTWTRFFTLLLLI